MRSADRFLWGYFVVVIAFLYLPLTMIVLFSFNVDATSRFPVRGLTLDWYQRLTQDQAVLSALPNSALVATGTTVVSTLLGTMAALALARKRVGRITRSVFGLLMMPFVVPNLIIAVALLTLFTVLQARLSLLTVIAGHIVITLPLVVVIVRARLLDMDRFIVEAARDLGAGAWQAFWRVTFPQMRSAVVGSMILTFATSFDHFMISFFTIGAESTLPIVIWARVRSGIDPVVNSTSALLLLTAAVVVVVASRFTKLAGNR